MEDRDPTLASLGPFAEPGEDSLYGDALSEGALCGEYVVLREIAQGGCGRIYAAEHRILGRKVAVKVLHREVAENAVMVQRFIQEARVVNLIRHPHIIDVFEFGQLPDGRPYSVMELLDGPSLRQIIAERELENNRFTAADALELLEPVCAALGAAHDVGVIHRDLKASNIVVATVDGRRVIKLLDFGIAKLLEVNAADGLTARGQILGTPATMAPEQFRGTAVDARTDVYALGVLLFQILTGKYPFMAQDSFDLERLHLESPAPKPSDKVPVASAIDALVLKALEKDMDKRFHSAGAFLSALHDAVRGNDAPVEGAGASLVGRPAVAIYVEAFAGDDLEAHLDDLAMAMDAAESALTSAGFTLAMQTSSSLLGVSYLDLDDAAEHRQLVAAAEMAGALRAELDGTISLPVNICLHADIALVRRAARGDVLGGALLRLGEWTPREAVAGVCATPAFARRMPDFGGTIVQPEPR